MNHPDDSLVPTTQQQLAWIHTVCERGIRRPASEADEWVTHWARDQFAGIGLQDVRLEPVVLPQWEPRSWSLEVWPDLDAETRSELRCFPLPHSAPADQLEAPVVRIGDPDARGSLVLDTVTLMEVPQSLARRGALRVFDPDGEFDDISQTLPFGRQMQLVVEPALEAGAAGFIGVFDAPWESCDYYVPYDAVERPIPGVWISRSDGERLVRLVEAGAVTARLTVDSSRTQVTTHNVIGTLPGASDDWVIVGSHHDGPWVSAVEDASGIALVVSQATYWSRVPADERPHNLLFLLTSGHMAHGAGTAAFIEAHRDFLDQVVCEIHLEHTARECRGEGGRLVATDAPEVRWWFTTRNDDLLDSVDAALRAEDLRRSMILPPDAFAPHPTTDGGFFHLEGVPLVNFLTAPMYLFDSQDTPDKIHEASLEPVTRAAIRIIDSLRGSSAADMRRGVKSEA